MGKNKTPYDVLKEEVADAVKKSGGHRHSRSDYNNLTEALLNSPDQEVSVYVKDGDNPVTTKPVEAYRNSLKPVLKQFGVDDAELGKIQEVQFSKNHAEAFNDLAAVAMKGYLDTGRRLVLPVTGPKESQLDLVKVDRDKTSEETKKIVQNEDGSYDQVPTGKRKTKEAHSEIKASNKLPGWLVSEEPI